MSRIFGYSRATISLPDLKDQADQLSEAGATHIFVDKNSIQARRALSERRRLLDELRSGDTLLLLGLDRLGTSFDDVLRTFELLVARGVAVRVIESDFSTAGSHEAAYRAILALLAGARSALASETIKANLAAARAKGGKAAGKAPSLRPEQWPAIKAQLAQGSLDTVAAEVGVSRMTLWRFQNRMTAADAAAAPVTPAKPARRPAKAGGHRAT